MQSLSASEGEMIRGFDRAVEVERLSIADVIERLKEIGRRRIYLKLGYNSLFSYLVEGKGYSPASAQRRIDAARILDSIPEVKRDLVSGSLNLVQISMVAQSIRQTQKEKQIKVGLEQKKELLVIVKGKGVQETQKILAQSLDIEIKTHEKKRIQKDLSVRLEMTLTQEQSELVQRAKELLSHKNPNPTMSELFAILAKYYVDREDPLRKKIKPKTTSTMEAAQSRSREIPQKSSVDLNREVSTQLASRKGEGASSSRMKGCPSASVRREVFQKYFCCQWKDPRTGRFCGSKFQLQTDHIQSVWAGGGNNAENLQLLCSVHNKLKYRMEAGLSYR